MDDSAPATFLDLRIRGVLTTQTPLHVGTGGRIHRPGSQGETLAVATDGAGRAYLPASTIKGVLRAWLRAHMPNATGSHIVPSDVVKRVFGEEKGGGRATFRDAPAREPDPDWEPPRGTRHFRRERLTGVVVGVAIDRCSRTALDRHLYTHEVVPPGVSFSLEIRFRQATSEEIALLLHALEAFGGGKLRLGAGTGDGWGQLAWRCEAVEELAWSTLEQWADGLLDPKLGVPEGVQEPIRSKARSSLNPVPSLPPIWRTTHLGSSLCIGVRLQFHGAFLVVATTEHEEGGESQNVLLPRRDGSGRIHLPASSFRGALRSQLERILRTMGPVSAAGPPMEAGVIGEAIDSLDRASELSPLAQLLGATGWRSPLSITDFDPETGADDGHHQTFVAVDRFTGGAKRGALYSVRAGYDSALCGRISIDLAALDRVGALPWAFALLALALRDLIEGDLGFGWGRARGYGACTAIVEDVQWDPQGLLAVEGWTEEDLVALRSLLLAWSDPQREAPRDLQKRISAWFASWAGRVAQLGV